MNLLLTVGIAAYFLIACLLQLILARLAANRPALAAQAVFLIGLGLFLNVVYPWWRLGKLARTGTVVMLIVAGMLSVYAGLRGSFRLRELIPVHLSDWMFNALGVVFVLLAVAMVAWPMPQGVALDLPVADGVWCVGQGGPLLITNHHRRVPEQRYALDLVRVGSDGKSARQPLSALDSHLAWDSLVVAPADGLVIAAVDGLPDLEIGRMDTANPAGNHIVLETPAGIQVLIAHLRQDSLLVSAGQQVTRGDPLAKVGNSGNTSEPHIHLHAMVEQQSGAWVGIPIYINGRTPHRGQWLRPVSGME